MSRFSVIPEQLESASATLGDTGSGDATLPPASLADAASSTPIASAWTTFFEQAVGASAALDEVSLELAAGLRSAATNYQGTETRATESFGRAR